MTSRVEARGPIAILTLDNPPVNALSHAVRAALVEGVQRLDADSDLQAMVINCAGRTFFAGADLSEFGKPSVEPFLTTVVDTIEASRKPIVAAIHGTALGGGLEVAMGCHYRIALAGAQLGLPEVKLGLIPGARGTQHLPRLTGIPKALDMIGFGEPIDAEEALSVGLIDRLVEGELLDCAVGFAREIADRPPPRTRDRQVAAIESGVFDEFLRRNARKFRGLDAPPALVAAIRAASELPFEQGAALEREIFLKLRAGPQNEALRHLFRAEREAAKLPELKDVEPRLVRRVGVVGAGTMGSGIAIAFLLAGLPVTLVERDQAALERGADAIARSIGRSVKSGRIGAEAAEAALTLLTCTLDAAQLNDADLVIEAAFETMEVKKDIFALLDIHAKAGALLATNTSYLDVDEIAASTSRPADVFGMHFFSPANIMKLLEIVRARETAPDVLATALAVAKRIGKIPVVAGNCHGFIGNRMLAVRRREAERMVAEGASPYEIDRVLEEFGFPMGPFRIGDLAGLDLGWSSETSTGATIRERLCEAGRRGQKVSAGFYDYDDTGAARPSAEAEAIIRKFAQDHGIAMKSISEEEILPRLVWPMIDEGAQILEEGIAARSSDIDVVWVHGYGWPAWTGGPMFHGARVGFERIAADLRGFGYQPSAALVELARAVR